MRMNYGLLGTRSRSASAHHKHEDLSESSSSCCCSMDAKPASVSNVITSITQDFKDDELASGLASPLHQEIGEMTPPDFDKKRQRVCRSFFAGLLVVLILIVSFITTLVNLRNDREIYRLLAEVEYLHKSTFQTRHRSTLCSSWISIEELTNNTITRPNWMIESANIDYSAELLDATMHFKRSYKQAVNQYGNLRKSKRQYKKLISAAKALAQWIEDTQDQGLHVFEKVPNAELTVQHEMRRGYDKKYTVFVTKVKNIQRSLHRDTQAAVAVGSVLFIGFAVLFVLLQLRSIDDIRMGEVSFMAKERLTHQFGVPSFIVDVDLVIHDANKAAMSALGLKRTAVLGRAITDFLHYDDGPPGHVAAARKAHAVHQPSGNVAYFMAHTIKLEEVGGSERSTIVCHNVSSSYELEIQRQVLSQFCHEARNKYTAAAAILEQILTLAAKPAQRVKAELTALHYDIVMSLALIHEVDMLVQTRLDLYRLSSGRYDTRQNTQTVGCFALLQSRVNAAGALANKGVSFDFTLPDTSGTGREFCIQVDTYVWAHIAQNFLSNARKHTLEGSVSLHFLGEFDGMLHFAVVDTGFGIPPHVATQLFREEVTTGTERGVGLGLVSCQKFAQAIGGDCWLHSTKVRTAESAGGTEFRFCLPGCIVASNSNAKEAGQVDVAAISSISDVFVVEDSCLIRKTIITKLKHAAKAADCSWRFHEHATVESVLPSVPHFAGRADVIITVDQNLDSAGGCLKGSDLIRTLQVHSFNGIVISATGDATLANQHIELGADLAWGKPLPNNKLVLRDLAQVCAGKLSKLTH